MAALENSRGAQASLQTARQMAENAGHTRAGPWHLLIALLSESEGFVAALLNQVGIKPGAIARAADRELKKQRTDDPASAAALDQIRARAAEIAEQQGADAIGEEHLFLATILLGTPEALGKLLNSFGVDAASIAKALNDLNRAAPDDPAPAGKPAATSSIDQFGVDLVARAKARKLSPVIGRDDEIRRVIRILSRKTKNNPVLIGEAGVGKTAVVEGLAQRIARGDVPERLKDRSIFSLDLAGLVAGTQFRGDFEDRLKKVLTLIGNSDGRVLLFIDELHNIVGAGSARDQPMDAGNILKPMLARGELHCIGATTLDEYRKHIEKDPALERRFQPIVVEPPDVETTTTILRGLREGFENHHGVRVQDSALVAASNLADRYISGRFMPDKAVDVVDEACAAVSTAMDSLPPELDQFRRRRMRLDMEAISLERNTDPDSARRLGEVRRESTRVSIEAASLEKRWASEKDLVTGMQKLRKELSEARERLDDCERTGEIVQAAELRQVRIPEMEQKLGSAETACRATELFKEVVTPDEIAGVVAQWTGIPVGRLLEGERDKLSRLADSLAARVIGQTEAVSLATKAILRARTGVKDPKRPTGSFLFLGPTGVGKTELAKAIAEVLLDSEEAMVTIDMSEYMEKHAVARLIGAPPGYVGYDQGGQLTEAVRRRPYCVVLFDEVEKAHPEVFNLLLQVLDEGRLTDGHGREVNFRNSVIVLTSNLGSQHLVDGGVENGRVPAAVRANVLADLKKHFRPEFLNRIDEVVTFCPLGEEQIAAILGLQLDALNRRLAAKKIRLDVDGAARRFLAEGGFDPVYGARPLRRFIQRTLENELAEAIVANKIEENSVVLVGVARRMPGKVEEADGSGALVLSVAGQLQSGPVAA
jgi:ATP-dependent Clp protease ATP-binding subunit ClpB